jgi:hypothetical protein
MRMGFMGGFRHSCGCVQSVKENGYTVRVRRKGTTVGREGGRDTMSKKTRIVTGPETHRR